MSRPRYSKFVDCKVGEGTKLFDIVNLYKCKIGDNCKIDSFVYIEGGVVIGNNCKIRAFTFIPDGVTIGNHVFVGPRVTFTNDNDPKVDGKWKLIRTVVDDYASIGAGAVILPGVRIGRHALIGAGSVVTKDVRAGTVVVGNPAKVIRKRRIL